VPPWLPVAALGLGIGGLLGLAQQRGLLVLVAARPVRALLWVGVGVVLVVRPVPVAEAGGGSGSVHYWVLSDARGSSLVVLDELGERVRHQTFTPFGAVHAEAGSGGWLPSVYAGHLWDGASGLYAMQARWQDPETGSFVSVDPVVPDRNDPQSYNAYAYARNNPVTHVDPTGMCVLVSHCFRVTYGVGYAEVPIQAVIFSMDLRDGNGDVLDGPSTTFPLVGGRLWMTLAGFWDAHLIDRRNDGLEDGGPQEPGLFPLRDGGLAERGLGPRLVVDWSVKGNGTSTRRADAGRYD